MRLMQRRKGRQGQVDCAAHVLWAYDSSLPDNHTSKRFLRRLVCSPSYIATGCFKLQLWLDTNGHKCHFKLWQTDHAGQVHAGKG